MDLLKTDVTHYEESNPAAIASAYGIISYMKADDPYRTNVGLYSAGWSVPRMVVDVILSENERQMIESFMESARRELRTAE